MNGNECIELERSSESLMALECQICCQPSTHENDMFSCKQCNYTTHRECLRNWLARAPPSRQASCCHCGKSLDVTYESRKTLKIVSRYPFVLGISINLCTFFMILIFFVALAATCEDTLMIGMGIFSFAVGVAIVVSLGIGVYFIKESVRCTTISRVTLPHVV